MRSLSGWKIFHTIICALSYPFFLGGGDSFFGIVAKPLEFPRAAPAAYPVRFNPLAIHYYKSKRADDVFFKEALPTVVELDFSEKYISYVGKP